MKRLGTEGPLPLEREFQRQARWLNQESAAALAQAECQFRNREFAADRYAAELGQAYELAETLDVIAPVDFSVPFLWGRSHPYTETRIDKLQAYARAHSGASAVR
jgi:hypothetical protein